MAYRSSIAAESRNPRRPRSATAAALLALLFLAACVDTKPRAEVEFRYADFTGSVPPQLLSLAFDDGALVSVHGPHWRLVIVGAGQLSKYLAQMAQALQIICIHRKKSSL